MKKIVFVILFASMFFSSCMDRCRVIEYYPPNEIAEIYCRNMTPDNYWMYTNQDNTKTDSVYFSYVPGEVQGKDIIKNICAGWYQRIMYLHSSCLSGIKIEVRYISGGANQYTFLSMDFPQGFSLGFYPDKAKCQTSIVGKAGLGKMNFINDVQIGKRVYLEVINIDDRFFIAPDVGIIRYVSYNNVDTFYLEKYKIK